MPAEPVSWLLQPLPLTLGLAAVALAFRLRWPTEHRTVRPAWTLLLLALLLQAARRLAPGTGTTAHLDDGIHALLGLAAIQVAGLLLHQGLLRRLGAPRIARDLTVSALSVAWLLLVLRLAGADPSNLFTTSALITAVLAFSMQDTLGNVLGGVALQLDNSLRVGDWVQLDEGVSGRVADVRWRYTAIETRTRERVIVPNAWLMKNRFAVLRAPEDGPLAWRRAVRLDVEARAEPARVIAVLEQALRDAEVPHVLTEPPPQALLADLVPGYGRYLLRYWLDDPGQDDRTDSRVRLHALAALARAGLHLGVPVEEHLMVKENEARQAALAQHEFDQRLDAVRNTALFARLPEAEQRQLAQHLVYAPFAQGDIVTRQGAVAHWLYLIVHGEVQVLVDGPQGPEPVARLRDGDFFGEMGMLTGEPRRATVRALSALACYRLDKEGFAHVLQARPDIAREVSEAMQLRQAARPMPASTPSPGSADLLARIRHFFSLGE